MEERYTLSMLIAESFAKQRSKHKCRVGLFKPMLAVPDELLRTTFYVCVCEAKLIFGGILWIVRYECEELGIWSLIQFWAIMNF